MADRPKHTNCYKAEFSRASKCILEEQWDASCLSISDEIGNANHQIEESCHIAIRHDKKAKRRDKEGDGSRVE